MNQARSETVSRFVAIGVGAVIALVFAIVPLGRLAIWVLGAIVHELGHTVVYWLTGRLAVPVIGVGGAHARAFGEVGWLPWVVLGVVIWLGWRLWKVAGWQGGVVGTLLVMVYGLFCVWPAARDFSVGLAGHGFEIFFAGIFVWRVWSGWHVQHFADRCATAAAAMMLLGSNVYLNWQIYSSHAFRLRYMAENHGGNDYVILDHTYRWMTLGGIALSMLVMCAVVPLAAVGLAWWQGRGASRVLRQS